MLAGINYYYQREFSHPDVTTTYIIKLITVSLIQCEPSHVLLQLPGQIFPTGRE